MAGCRLSKRQQTSTFILFEMLGFSVLSLENGAEAGGWNRLNPVATQLPVGASRVSALSGWSVVWESLMGRG